MTELAHHLVDMTPLWTTVFGLATALLIGWFAVHGIDWAPILVIASVPIQRALLISAGDRSLTYTQVWLSAFVVGASLCFARGGMRIRIDLVLAVFGLLVSAIGMSVVANPSPGTWVGEVYRWVTPFVFFALARSYFGPSSARHIGITLSALLVGCGGWAAWQIGDAAGPTSFERNGLMRVTGSFGEPNPFAAFLIFSALAVAGLAWHCRREPVGWMFGLSAAIGVGAAVLTQSRGGLLGLVAGLAVFAVAAVPMMPRQWRLPMFRLGGLGAALAVLAVVQIAPWQIRLQDVTSANWAEREREAHWSAAWQLFLAHPWFGVGAGAFNDRFRQYTTDWHFRIPRGHAHNAYLQMAATAGLAATMLYLGLLAITGRRLIQRASDHVWNGIALGTLAATAALAIHGVFDYLHVLSLGLLFAGMWACALGVREKDQPGT